MKLVTTILLPFLLSSILNAQIIIEPLDKCISDIIDWHRQSLNDELQALNIYKEKKWYNLLPRPGIGYELINSRPMFTLTMPDFISFINRRKDLKYSIHKAVVSANQRITTDTTAFISAYYQLQNQIRFYYDEKALINQDSVLLSIKIEENKKLQATTEDVLKLRLAILQKQFNHSKTIQSVLSQAAALEPHLHRSFRIIIPQTAFP
jgi:uncharacterized protein YhaN